MPQDAPRKEALDPPLLRRLARRLRSRKVLVENESMRPTLEPGDRLLVDPRAYALCPPARGDLVVLRDPERPGRLLVKRVVGTPGDAVSAGGTVLPGEVAVEGDNPSGRDSRAFGPVPLGEIRGRAWWRYYPAARSGRL